MSPSRQRKMWRDRAPECRTGPCWSFRSVIETAPLGIDENCPGHFHRDVAARHRHHKRLILDSPAILDHRERDRAAERRAMVGRCHMTQRGPACGHRDLCALLEHDGWICGVETDKLLPALRHARRPVEPTLSDKIGDANSDG